MSSRRKPNRRPLDRPSIDVCPDDEAAFRALEPVLVVMPRRTATFPRYDVLDAVSVVRRLVEAAAPHREKLGALEAATPGVLHALETTGRAASALVFAEHQVHAIERAVIVPHDRFEPIEALRAETSAIIEAHAGSESKVLDELPPPRGSSGFRGWLDDLELIDELCERRAPAFPGDRTRLRIKGAARQLAAAIEEEIDPLVRRDAERWSSYRARLNTLMATGHEWLRRAVIFLEDTRDSDLRFPPLVVAAAAVGLWRAHATPDTSTPVAN
ncbi:hypothetical protein L6R52_34300 [Myxococcota bacterium]|nr:hypothetical protein [Myxococcota bacterium]